MHKMIMQIFQELQVKLVSNLGIEENFFNMIKSREENNI